MNPSGWGAAPSRDRPPQQCLPSARQSAIIGRPPGAIPSASSAVGFDRRLTEQAPALFCCFAISSISNQSARAAGGGTNAFDATGLLLCFGCQWRRKRVRKKQQTATVRSVTTAITPRQITWRLDRPAQSGDHTSARAHRVEQRPRPVITRRRLSRSSRLRVRRSMSEQEPANGDRRSPPARLFGS